MSKDGDDDDFLNNKNKNKNENKNNIINNHNLNKAKLPNKHPHKLKHTSNQIYKNKTTTKDSKNNIAIYDDHKIIETRQKQVQLTKLTLPTSVSATEDDDDVIIRDVIGHDVIPLPHDVSDKSSFTSSVNKLVAGKEVKKKKKEHGRKQKWGCVFKCCLCACVFIFFVRL